MRWLIFLTAVVALHSETPAPHIRAAAEAFQEGEAAQKQKEFGSAVTLFQKAIEIEPTFEEARKALIRVNIDSGQQLEAAKALIQLLELEPADVVDRVLLGHILLEQKESARALAQFSAALSLEPNNADALSGFAIAAANMGMEDRAREALDRGRKHYPADRRFQTPDLHPK